MAAWDPAVYLEFAQERSRPFLDLVQRIPAAPRTIVDLGCGPGHLMPVLRARWPEADLTGVDSSPEMIERARASDPGTRYELASIEDWVPDQNVDLVISNAAFQWVPGQREVISRLAQSARTIAFQVPNNFAEPGHTLLHEIAGRAPYAPHTPSTPQRHGVSAEMYLDLLARPGWTVDAWETRYLHVLHGDNPVFDWISGTGARPVLQSLPPHLRDQFEREYKTALAQAYPARPWGTVLPFTRVFVVATRTP